VSYFPGLLKYFLGVLKIAWLLVAPVNVTVVFPRFEIPNGNFGFKLLFFGTILLISERFCFENHYRSANSHMNW
jgi:hypothetical protein